MKPREPFSIGEARILTASTCACSMASSAGPISSRDGEINSEYARCILELWAARKLVRVGQCGDPTRLGHELVQQFMPLNIKFATKNANASGIAAWSRHTGRKPGTHHIVGHPDDRDGSCRALNRLDCWVAESDDEVDLLCRKFARQHRQLVISPRCPPELETNVSPLFPTKRPHITREGPHERLIHVLRSDAQYTNHRHRWLLRALRAATPQHRQAA